MPSGEFERARAGVVARLRARRGEIDEAIFARVSGQWFDRAGSEDPAYVAGLRAAGVAALDYVLTGVERSGKFLEPVPAAVLEQARRAARVGVGVDTVLRRYQAGYAVLVRFVIEEAERDELERIGSRPPSALGDLLQIVSALVDRLSAAVSKAYNKEIEQAGDAIERGGEATIASEDRLAPERQEASSDRAGSGASAGPGASRPALEGTKRERILQAIVEVVAERGVKGASVELVIARAKVSRRTFYEHFANLDEGVIAVLDGCVEQVGSLTARAFEEERGPWQDGMRAALAAVLDFFDSERDLVKVYMVETLAAAPIVRERRERSTAVFRSLVVKLIQSEVSHPSALAPDALLASVMGTVRARLIDSAEEPLIGLLGPLMGVIVGGAMDEEAIAREIEKGDELAARILEQRRSQPPAAVAGSPGVDVALIPPALRDPRAHRARLCLIYVAEQSVRGLSPSNQEIGEAIGVSHRGQLAKLLHRLAEEGLLVKRKGSPGHPNAWSATPAGERVAQALADYR
jgi:AcrR family transcriptional regulator